MKATQKQKSKIRSETAAKATTKSKAHAGAKTHSKVKSHLKLHSQSKMDSKSKAKGKSDQVTEAVPSAKEESRKVFAQAAAELQETEQDLDTELEESEVTHVDQAEIAKEMYQKAVQKSQSLVQADPAAAVPPAPAAAAKSVNPYAEIVNSFANEPDTPAEVDMIKKIESENDHPVYQDMITRFLGNSDAKKDKYHEMWAANYKDATSAKYNADHHAYTAYDGINQQQAYDPNYIYNNNWNPWLNVDNTNGNAYGGYGGYGGGYGNGYGGGYGGYGAVTIPYKEKKEDWGADNDEDDKEKEGYYPPASEIKHDTKMLRKYTPQWAMGYGNYGWGNGGGYGYGGYGGGQP